MSTSSSLSNQLRDSTLSLFSQAFSSNVKPGELIIASAPGRVNLIGEHTDYNDGFVMPMAIERETFIVGRRSQGKSYRLVSQNVSDTRDAHGHEVGVAAGASNYVIAEFSYEQLITPVQESLWHNYFRGVVAQYAKAGHRIPPFECAIAGNVPLGGGLSSSASLEVATATFLDGLLGINTDGVKKALMCQKAEHEFAHVPCGIMDQFISALGQERHAMLLDCRSEKPRLVPLVDPHVTILITSMSNTPSVETRSHAPRLSAHSRACGCFCFFFSDSNVKHALGSGEYAKRRAQCEEALRVLQGKYPALTSLRDATLPQLHSRQAAMSPIAYARARHVITECERTVAAAQALEKNDYKTMGTLMTQSHVSLKGDYEVSCDELDTLVDIALSQRGVYGSRMTGGGFGGCTVTLVETSLAKEVEQTIKQQYKQRTGKEATTMTSTPAQGARLHKA